MSESTTEGIGKTVSSYRILAPLGKEGAWKSVYLGISSVPGDDQPGIVALKSYKTRDGVKDAIERDVRNINILLEGVDGSEYLSKSRYLGEFYGAEWLAEPLWSSSLYDFIRSNGPMRDVMQIAKMTLQLGSGLAALHEKNIRHTDIKPENCGVFRSQGEVKRFVLGDFGCAATSPKESPEDPRLVGTQRTRAPEVFTEQKFGLQGDVWALGATIYSLIAQKYPFMAFDALHGSEEERRKREEETGERMDTLLAEFRLESRNLVPPIIYEGLSGCFDSFEARSTAGQLVDKFKALVRKFEDMGDEERVMALGAWRRAEDLLTQSRVVGGSVSETERHEIAKLSAYVPATTLQALGISI